MSEIILATHNEYKVQEINAIMEGFPYHFVSLKDKEYRDEIIETGTTFDENARLKATTIGAHFGQMTLADDSGLEVDALHGAPGIYSARYAGDGATPEQLCQKLLHELKDIPLDQRGARFRCVMALYDPDKQTCHMVEGIVNGRIASSMRGSHGFGYDPVFEVLETGKTMAEMSPQLKNTLSHRFRAIQFVKEHLLEYPIYQ